MIKVTYDSNNSGGGWWLDEKDWDALEANGWKVHWGNRSSKDLKKGEETWLGALAVKASKEFPSVRDAIIEFEELTGEKATDEGCNCCGPPHTFEWTDENGKWNYASGEGCLEYLYPDADIPKDVREALDKMR